jgi:phage terminase large subunit-like protein
VVFLAARDQFRGYDYMGVPSTGSKEARAIPASRAAYNGLIKVVRAPWNDQFFAELEAFPDGKHDDIPDSFDGAFNELAKGLRDATHEFKLEDIAATGSNDSFDEDGGIGYDEELGDLFG